MKNLLFSIVILAASALSASAFAINVDMTPGLWEHSFVMKSKSGEMEKAMEEMREHYANMPPEQRKMVEKMMAEQGVSITPKAGQETSIKSCVTQADIDRGYLPEQENCDQEILEQSKNTFKIKFTCNSKPVTRGTGELVFSSPKAYTGTSSLVTEVNGKPEEMTIKQRGKWLSSDCGNIQPQSHDDDEE